MPPTVVQTGEYDILRAVRKISLEQMCTGDGLLPGFWRLSGCTAGNPVGPFITVGSG